MSTTPTPAGAVVPASAATAPGPLERFRLAAMAMLGVVVYQALLVGPWVIFTVANPWTNRFGWWPVVVLVVFFVWVLQPNVAVPGTPLRRDEAPRLFEMLDDLARRLGAPRVHEVRLLDEFNAAAMEAPVPWQAWRKRRVLLLGVPLLGLLDVPAVRSVVAHELGHFSHRHGRAGHWIYRTRAEWEAMAQRPLAETSPLERVAAAFAHWFAPRFSRLAFRYSRHCEYEADAYAASIESPAGLARSLLMTQVLGERWAALNDRELPRLVAERPEPPAAWLSDVQQALLSAPPGPAEWAQAKRRAADPHDTHPGTPERLRALGVEEDQALAAGAVRDPVAGAVWLADWDGVVRDFDARWASKQASLWRQEHVRLRHQRDRLDRLRAAGDTGLARAELELELGSAEEALALAARHPAAAAALFVAGAARLRQADAAGAAALEDCVKADPRWALRARLELARHEALLDDAHARRNRVQLARAVDKRSAALGTLIGLLHQGQMRPARLDPVAREVLCEVLSGMPEVAAAWCAGLDEHVHGDRRYPAVVLVVRLRTLALAARGLDEDEVRGELAVLLGKLLPAEVLHTVWTVYTTEALAPDLDACLSGWSRAGDPCCLVMPREGESVAAGVRASALG